MVFHIQEIDEDTPHRWAVLFCACNLKDDEDALVRHMIQTVRMAYGEHEVMSIAHRVTTFPAPDASVSRAFNLQAINAAFRMGLPNPDVEAKKIPHLSNYRSETTELIARSALAVAHEVEFPTSPQLGKTNANQPILGFDGWGLLSLNGSSYALVLVQVKGTEERNRPPKEAHTLVAECRQVPNEPDKLCRALSILIQKLENTPYETAILTMLELLGEGQLPFIIVAPVIVRGNFQAHRDDLQPLKTASNDFLPAFSRGVTVSVGVSLGELGHLVMTSARQTDG